MPARRDARRRERRAADRVSVKQRSQGPQPQVGADSGVPAGSARVLTVVFLVALAIRLTHLWQLREAPFFVHLMGDSRGYDEWAQQVAAHRCLLPSAALSLRHWDAVCAVRT